ncbi:MAG TPA: SelT/SelW/SelH family protein [Pirellulales bacterium]
MSEVDPATPSAEKPKVVIEYCIKCRWLLRAAWTAQELLTTFEGELGEVTLRPGEGGVFNVTVSGREVWNRAQAGRFPEMKELKQLIRDVIAPDKSLGHSDRPAAT